MSLLAPLALALLGLLPIIVLLYFLKLKRRNQAVSSTYLWQRAVQDLRVNSPFQKLRKNLLLWLQLLLLALLILALARPTLDLRGRQGQRHICLLDTSASMGADDLGETRLEAAKEEVERLIGDLSDGDEMMLITFDVKPGVVVPYTGIRSQLREALEEIELKETGTDYAKALDLVKSLAEGGERNVELYVISDGAFQSAAPEGLEGVALNYVSVGRSGDNAGITAVDARSSIHAWGHPEIFARVQNFGADPITARVELYLDETLFAAKEVAVGGNDGAAVTFSDPELRDGLVHLVLRHDDPLDTDNHAWLYLSEVESIRTLIVTEGNYFLELAAMKDPLCDPVFMTLSDFESQLEDGTLGLSDYDVILFDRESPAALPQGSYIFLGAAPPIEGFGVEEEVEFPTVIDWDETHPVNQYVGYGSLFVESALKLTVPRGAATLVDSTAGPLVVWWESELHRLIVVGFDMWQSRWPLRVSFPVFFANAIRAMGMAGSRAGVINARPGEVIRFSVSPGVTEVAVTDPAGNSHSLPVAMNRVVFDDTTRCGPYRFREDLESGRIAVINLANARESNIRPREELAWSGASVAAASKAVKANREVWPWFALVGLIVLMVEWYVYNRRVYL